MKKTKSDFEKMIDPKTVPNLVRSFSFILVWFALFFGTVYFCSGCAVSRQNFVDQSFDEGFMVREVKGKSLTIAPPFGSSAISDHTLEMDEVDSDWSIQMGSKGDLAGGELTPEIISVLRMLMAP